MHEVGQYMVDGSSSPFIAMPKRSVESAPYRRAGSRGPLVADWLGFGLEEDPASYQPYPDNEKLAARYLGQLNHPNLIRVVDVVENCAFSEYVHGVNVFSLSLEKGFPHGIVLRILMDLLLGMQAMHDAGCTSALDFLEAVVGIDGVSRLGVACTRSGHPFKGFRLINPDLFEDTPDFRLSSVPRSNVYLSNVYLVGRACFRMVTGVPRYVECGPIEILDGIRSGGGRLPSEISQEHARFDDFIAKACARRPEDRFQRVDGIIHALLKLGTPVDHQTVESFVREQGRRQLDALEARVTQIEEHHARLSV
jgi:serine/threonine protein kinase